MVRTWTSLCHAKKRRPPSTGDHLGDGAGKWRLTISTSKPITVVSLITTPNRHLSNVSR